MANTGGLLNRANHVGEQSMGTITGLYAALDEINPQDNLAANAAPTVNNDSTEGYQPRSIWIYNGVTYRCIDATPGAAVWVETGISADDLGSAAFASTADFDPAGAAQAAAEFARQRANQTGTQPLSTIEGVGAAASRNVVGGSGDLMAVGFSGLGVSTGSAYILPWEESPVGGFYSVGSTDVAGPVSDGFPSQQSGSTMYAAAWSAGNWSKMLVDGRGDNSLPPEIYVKAANFGSVKKAVRLCHSNNILATVRMTGGTPTGGIIEQGSNSNGGWLKLADGAYRVMLSTSAAAVGGNISSIQSVRSIPVEYSSFVSTPRLMISARLRNYEEAGLPVEARCVSLHGELIPDTSECRFVADFNPSIDRTRNEAYELTIILEGRWY